MSPTCSLQGKDPAPKLFEINKPMFYDIDPIPMKHGMRRLGVMPRNKHRPPQVPATPEFERQLAGAGLL